MVEAAVLADVTPSDHIDGEPAAVAVVHDAIVSEAVSGTVVVPLHDHAPFIRERLESLFAQWRPDLELLLVDDGSTDEGYAIALSVLEEHPHIRATFSRERRRTGQGLLPVILALSNGRYIIQADSDDVALPGRLDAIAACFSSDPACRLVTSNALLISAEGYSFAVYDPLSPSAIFADPAEAAARDGDYRWLGATAAFHRDLFDAFPLIETDLCPYGLDLITPLRALLLGTHHYIAEPLVDGASMEETRIGFTASSKRLIQWRSNAARHSTSWCSHKSRGTSLIVAKWRTAPT